MQPDQSGGNGDQYTKYEVHSGKWEPEQVAEAAERIVEIKPEIELKFRIGDTLVKGRLAEFADQIHIAQLNGRYAVILERDSFVFDKAFSPVELMQPEPFEVVAEADCREEG